MLKRSSFQCPHDMSLTLTLRCFPLCTLRSVGSKEIMIGRAMSGEGNHDIACVIAKAICKYLSAVIAALLY